MKLILAEIERRVDQTENAWQSSCPEQPFADMTLEQLRERLRSFRDAKAKFAAAEAQWETARRERNAAYAKAMDLIKCVANSVKGHPNYGENSAVYSAMGYVPKSERSSGLTRKRATQVAKEAVEAS